MNNKLTNETDELQKELQEWIIAESSLIAEVVKSDWPKNIGISEAVSCQPLPSKKPLTWRRYRKKDTCVKTVYTYSLQHVALESSKVGLNTVQEDLPAAVNGLKHNLRCLWERYFVSKFIELVPRSVCRGDAQVEAIDLPLGGKLLTTDSLYRIGFFGQPIYPTKLEKTKSGTKSVTNRKYARAAEQLLVFHPDVVHFKFVNLEKWAGDINWLNIRNVDPTNPAYNPDCSTGFFRVVCTAAAAPRKTHLGRVVTAIPSGFRGWLWWVCWKVVGKA